MPYTDPRQDEKAAVVDNEVKTLLLVRCAPTDEALSVTALPRRGTPAQESKPLATVFSDVAQRFTDELAIAEVVVPRHELTPTSDVLPLNRANHETAKIDSLDRLRSVDRFARLNSLPAAGSCQRGGQLDETVLLESKQEIAAASETELAVGLPPLPKLTEPHGQLTPRRRLVVTKHTTNVVDPFGRDHLAAKPNLGDSTSSSHAARV
jgi:hypothetical protein